MNWLNSSLHQTGQSPNTDQVREQVWNQVVNESIFYAEAAKLGIEFTGKELTAVLYSNDPSNPLMSDRSMLDPAGKIDPAKVVSAINTIKKAKRRSVRPDQQPDCGAAKARQYFR